MENNLQLEFAWDRVEAMDRELKKRALLLRCATLSMDLAAQRLRRGDTWRDVVDDLERVSAKLTAGTFPR